MRSYWRETPMPRFPKPEGDEKTEVLIIGGGIAGILTAYFLQRCGVPYVLAEKDRICCGSTGNTTAKLTAQHGLIYDRLLSGRGPETARKYLDANLAALNEYARLCGEIDCDYEQRDSFVYSADRRKLERELRALACIGFGAELTETLPLPVQAAGAVRFPQQAQFHPLRFLSAVAKDLHIYEQTFVRTLDGCTAVTDSGQIRAEYVVCAAHFPFIDRHGGYFLKLYQHRSYVIALENAPDVGGMYVDADDAGLSFRNAGGLLLLGGGGARTGKRCGGWEALRRFAREHYPQSEEKYSWAAQDCMSLDGVPYIGQYARATPRLFVETGFNKWGMTGAMVSAMLVCDRILGKENDFADVFAPSRSILTPQLAVNGFESVTNLLSLRKKRCTHLGCALQWNRAEQSWDCPCHGSRFSRSGSVLDDPADKDLHPGS